MVTTYLSERADVEKNYEGDEPDRRSDQPAPVSARPEVHGKRRGGLLAASGCPRLGQSSRLL